MRTMLAGRSGRLVRGAGGVLAFLAVVEAAARSGRFSRDQLPPPTVVGQRLWELVTGSELRDGTAVTLTCWLGGLGIAVAVAVPLGLLLGSVPVLNVASRALIEFLRPIPSVAIVPATILVLGLGVHMRLFVVAYAATWPILFNTIYGLMEVDPLARETARSFGFGRLSILLRIALTSAAPFVMTGIRLSAGIALIVEVSVELIVGGEGGIGELLRSSQSGGARLDVALALVTFAGLLGVAANALLQAVNRRAFGWSSLVELR